MSDSKVQSSGINFSSLLLLLFIGLKLGGVIDWSWWWVMAPAWGPGLVLLILAGICLWISKVSR